MGIRSYTVYQENFYGRKIRHLPALPVATAFVSIFR